jgi:hypothetical protein
MRWSRIIGLTVLALILIPSFGIALAEPVLTVSLDEDSYEPGDWVEIEGNTNVTGTVYLEVTNSTDYVILEDDTEPVDEEFSFEFQLDEDLAPGVYEANVTVGTLTEILEFEVEEDESPCDVCSLENLTCAIDRAFWFIEKVNATANVLDGEGYNVTSFWDMLEEMNDTLTELLYNVTNEVITLEEAAEIFSDLRGDLGRLNGLLHSSTKKVKEDKAWRFMERMERLINSTVEKINRFNETENGEKWRAALEAHQRKLHRLRLTLNASNVDDLVGAAENVTETMSGDLDGFESNGFSWKTMFKVQARVQVLNETVQKMHGKGKENNRLKEKLENAEQLLGDWESEAKAKNWGKMKDLVEDANENLGGVGKTIRDINKQNKSNKGGNGKEKGKNKGK